MDSPFLTMELAGMVLLAKVLNGEIAAPAMAFGMFGLRCQMGIVLIVEQWIDK